MKRNIGKYVFMGYFIFNSGRCTLSFIDLAFSCLHVKERMKFYVLLDSDRNYFS